MLEDEKQRLIDAIHSAEQTIQKAEAKIQHLTELEKQEENPIKKWYDHFMIGHYKNKIHDSHEDIQKLVLDLETTKDAIASRQRDMEIIERNEHFLLPTDLPVHNSKDQTENNEPDWVTSLSNVITSFITKTSSNLNKSGVSLHRHSSKEDPTEPKDTPDFKS